VCGWAELIPARHGLFLIFENEEMIMRLKLFVPALALLTTTLAAVPATAQYAPVYGPGYYGPGYYGPAYRTRVFRDSYNYGPAIGPLFYGDGWVPEPIFDHSRAGGVDPYIRPSN
jgi:hypothetical protein